MDVIYISVTTSSYILLESEEGRESWYGRCNVQNFVNMFSFNLCSLLNNTLDFQSHVNLTRAHTLSISLSHTHTLSLSLSLSLTRTLSLSHTHTHTLSLSLSPSPQEGGWKDSRRSTNSSWIQLTGWSTTFVDCRLVATTTAAQIEVIIFIIIIINPLGMAGINICIFHMNN